MIVHQIILNSMGFIAEFVGAEPDDDSYDLVATGFILSLPSTVHNQQRFHYFVTAKHVIEGLRDRTLSILVNHVSGGRCSLAPIGGVFHRHPDSTVDVAVVPFKPEPGLAGVSSIPTHMFLTPQLAKEKKIGVGDEVFCPGLFTFAPGKEKNIPVVRFGNIAMMPDEAIQVGSGFAHVYLIEARSIGGYSGSPVFIRETKAIEFDNPDGTKSRMYGHGPGVSLLGVVQDHWDISECDLHKYKFEASERHKGVNLGLAAVVPATKILETLNLPALVQMRKETDDEFTKQFPRL